MDVFLILGFFLVLNFSIGGKKDAIKLIRLGLNGEFEIEFFSIDQPSPNPFQGAHLEFFQPQDGKYNLKSKQPDLISKLPNVDCFSHLIYSIKFLPLIILNIETISTSDLMKMKKRYLIPLILMGLILGTFITLYVIYKIDMAKIEAALPGDSELIETKMGPVEIKRSDSGTDFILIAHETPGSHRLLENNRLLAKEYNLIKPSRSGYFRSPLNSGETPEAQADLFAALLDKLEITSVVMLGISGGGPSAIQFAIRHPGRCKALVLWAAVSEKTPEYEDPPSGFGLWLYHKIRIAMINDEMIERKYKEYFYPKFFPHSQIEKGWANDERQFSNLKPFQFEKISTPTLIVYGSNDLAIEMQHIKNVADNVPNSILIPLENKGHDALYLEPELFAQPTIEFLLSLK